jgi:hypothetical protein
VAFEPTRDPPDRPAPDELPANPPLFQPQPAFAQQELPPNHPPIRPETAFDQQELPSNHPPLEPTAPPHAADPGKADEKLAINWRVPQSWRSIPNASTMRIGTYQVPSRGSGADAAEMTVVRAGGSTDANIERWLGQFADASGEKRTERRVHGLKVTTVEVGGTFTGGSGPMAMAAQPVRHPGWALLGAIVETEGSPYFFKLLGPAATLRQARAEFQSLIDSIAPGNRGPAL